MVYNFDVDDVKDVVKVFKDFVRMKIILEGFFDFFGDIVVY